MNPESISSVYFVEAVGLDLIKIGYAADLRSRFIALLTSSPAPLSLLGTMQGGPKMEAFLHRELSAHRSHGEWFRKSPQVMEVVATAKPMEGQDWLNQTARRQGAALMEYLAKMKRGEVIRPTRGPTRPEKRKTHDRYGNPLPPQGTEA